MHTSHGDNTLPGDMQKDHGLPVGRRLKPLPREESAVAHRKRPAQPDAAFYTIADHIVLTDLYRDINRVYSGAGAGATSHDDPPPSPDDEAAQSLTQLSQLTDPTSDLFQPTIFVSWDYDVTGSRTSSTPATTAPPQHQHQPQPQPLPSLVLLRRWYVTWARNVVRHDTDVVFLTHILLYLATSLPSAVYLYRSFHYLHAAIHTLLSLWYASSFTLLLHNHIHNKGVLSKQYALADFLFPYVLEPLMGHTWDSYYYHHVKHHHVESNGPDDLSSTLRYQRDSVMDFLRYEARFLLLCWVELPLYFVRKGKYGLACKSTLSELSSYLFMYLMARWQFRPTLFVLLLPFAVIRLILMVGNWGQHALVDETDPNSDLRSSITLIDVPSNRFCFNDGYHTSHHLNPLRHWRDHPRAFLKAKHRYSKEGALVFHNIDYLGITFCLLTKNYARLARQLVPMGEQIHMTEPELMAMLKTKTRRFTEEEIRSKFNR